MDKQYTFTDFVGIIKALRAENGCPWDREQTHESLKPCMTEEAAELLAAIRIYDKTGDAENMREELGDILLQVVMHSVIAEEEKLFTMEDVIGEVSEKMIRRHPHVFGDVIAETSGEVLENWEEIKKKEKEGKSWIKSPLREIPLELPALARACKVIKKADKLYGLAEDADTLFDRLIAAGKKVALIASTKCSLGNIYLERNIDYYNFENGGIEDVNAKVAELAANDKALEDADKALEILKANGEDAYIIGEIIKSEDGVTFR